MLGLLGPRKLLNTSMQYRLCMHCKVNATYIRPTPHTLPIHCRHTSVQAEPLQRQVGSLQHQVAFLSKLLHIIFFFRAALIIDLSQIQPSGLNIILRMYSRTLIIGPLLGEEKRCQISEVVTLSRWFKHNYTKTCRLKSGHFGKVVRLSRWSHFKVPLYCTDRRPIVPEISVGSAYSLRKGIKTRIKFPIFTM